MICPLSVKVWSLRPTKELLQGAKYLPIWFNPIYFAPDQIRKQVKKIFRIIVSKFDKFKATYAKNATRTHIHTLGPRDHVTPSLRHLYWLPLEQRIIFKLCSLMHLVNISSTRSSLSTRTCLVDIWQCFSYLTPFVKRLTESSETPTTHLKISERCFSFPGSTACHFYLDLDRTFVIINDLNEIDHKSQDYILSDNSNKRDHYSGRVYRTYQYYRLSQPHVQLRLMNYALPRKMPRLMWKLTIFSEISCSQTSNLKT